MSVQNNHIDSGCRQYAFEGRCFVVVSCGYMTLALPPSKFGLNNVKSLDANGGSGIIGPDGEYLVGPLYGKEDILYADVDLKSIIDGKCWSDVVGHYERPDVVQREVQAYVQLNVFQPSPRLTSRQVDEVQRKPAVCSAPWGCRS